MITSWKKYLLELVGKQNSLLFISTKQKNRGMHSSWYHVVVGIRIRTRLIIVRSLLIDYLLLYDSILLLPEVLITTIIVVLLLCSDSKKRRHFFYYYCKHIFSSSSSSTCWLARQWRVYHSSWYVTRAYCHFNMRRKKIPRTRSEKREVNLPEVNVFTSDPPPPPPLVNSPRCCSNIFIVVMLLVLCTGTCGVHRRYIVCCTIRTSCCM